MSVINYYKLLQNISTHYLFLPLVIVSKVVAAIARFLYNLSTYEIDLKSYKHFC